MIMVVKTHLKKIVSSEEGTSIFEFIFFLPLMVVLMGILVSIGSSINGSINQQKVTRSYFYARVKNNSTFPLKAGGQNNGQGQWQNFGMFFIGWKVRFTDARNLPLQPCFRLHLPLEDQEDQCLKYDKNTTNFLRVGTVYGACGATYMNPNNDFNLVARAPSLYGDITIGSKPDGCYIRE